ncbi:MAG: SGNH/GDSL hydrolase family protein [Culicoidibacterales bacterium]
MILFEGIYAPNIQAVIHKDGHNILSRYDQHLVTQLGHEIPFQHCATELIFVPQERVEITITSLHSFVPAKCLIMVGTHAHGHEQLIQGPTRLIIDPPTLFDANLVAPLTELSKQLVRILLYGDQFEIQAIIGRYRAPYEWELPKKQLLVYGTSISQGIGATAVEQPYAWQLAQRCGAQLYNYALSGKCWLEPDVIDAFVIGELKYDYIIYECSVNMLGAGFDCDTYEERLHYLLQQTKKYQPKAQVFLTSVLPYFGDFGYIDQADCCVSTAKQYRQRAETICQAYAQVVYMDPFELLDPKNLSSDLIHPSNQGMSQIAQNIERYIKGEK